MLKQNHYHQQSSSSGTPDHGSSTTQPDVFELVNENEESAQTSLMLKLTDECSAAIRSAVKHKLPIRMHVRNGEATIEVPQNNGDVLNFKCSLQNQPATDTIYFDPQRKIYKNIGSTTTARLQVQATDKTFAEMKEKTQRLVEAEQQRKTKDMTQGKTMKGHQKSAHNHIMAQNYRNKNSPLTTTTTTTMANTNSIRAKFGAATTSSLATKRTHSPLPPTKVIVPPKRRELDGPSIKKEVMNVKQEQKIGSPYSSTNNNNNDKKNLFYIPNRKPIQQQHRAPSISPASTATSTPKTISPPLAMTCPASVDSTQLQHSSSCSPEDTVLGPEEQHLQQKQQIGSITLSVKPSEDWSRQFGKIETSADAKRYLNIFKSDYPEYRQCYDELERVANEFRALQNALKNAVEHSERFRVEAQIRSKFAAYQCDTDFLRKRQRHHDLRAKLEVIKQALSTWNENNDYNRANAKTVAV